jgi:hypothetical protein
MIGTDDVSRSESEGERGREGEGKRGRKLGFHLLVSSSPPLHF